jgi:plasmid stabilization system protein ParE
MVKGRNNYTILYLQKAAKEYERAIAWYNDISPEVADRFINAVRARIDILQNDPHRYRNTHKQFHEIALKKFPYLLVYVIEENEKQVLISSVHHHKQNPKRKFKA